MALYTFSDSTIAQRDYFNDVAAESATAIRSNESLSATIPITFTISAQPDEARTLKWSFDTHANITAFTLQFIGINGRGETVTEEFSTGWTGETNQAYAIITSIKLTSRTGTGSGDTMDIGTGSKLGLSTKPSTVYKVKKNNADLASASYTLNSIYGTVAVSITAGDDFTVLYKGMV